MLLSPWEERDDKSDSALVPGTISKDICTGMFIVAKEKQNQVRNAKAHPRGELGKRSVPLTRQGAAGSPWRPTSDPEGRQVGLPRGIKETNRMRERVVVPPPPRPGLRLGALSRRSCARGKVHTT